MSTTLLQQTKVKKGVVYARVSYDGTQSLNEQQHISRHWMETQSKRAGCKYEIIQVLNEAESTTGKNDRRPMYQKLIVLVKSGEIQFVVIKSIDRLNRKVADFSNFIELCKKHNVELYIHGIDADLSTPTGLMLVQMLAVIAEMEGNTILQRSISSIRSLQRTKGKINGGPALLGYEIDHTIPCTRRINLKEKEIVIFIFTCFTEQKDIQQTLKKLNEVGVKTKQSKSFNREGLIRLLTSQIYIGRLKITGTDEYTEIPTRIIDDDLFQLAQNTLNDILSKHRFTYKSQKRIYPLTGLLVSNHGYFFKGTSGKGRNKKTYFYYREKNSKKSFLCQDIEALVFEALRVLIKNSNLKEFKSKTVNYLSTESDILQMNIETLENEVTSISKKISKLTDKLLEIENISNDFIKHMESSFETLKNSKEKTERQLSELREQLQAKEAVPIAIGNIEAFLNGNKTLLCASVSLDAQRSFFRKIFKSITIDLDANIVKFYWNLQVSHHEIKIPYEYELKATSRDERISTKLQLTDDLINSKLYQLSVVEKATGAAIAKQLGVSRTTVISYQKKLGIKARATGKNRKRARGLAYGKNSISNGTLVINHGEQKVINAIRVWRSDGKTFREIANILNTQQVKTKTGRGTWHAKTIHQIFSRISLQDN